MPSGWRIQKARHAAAAFSGEGGRRYRGRWNSAGVPVVYLSQHQSMAVLEVYVHAKPLSAFDDFVVIGAEWPEGVMETLPASKLPANWKSLPAGLETAEIGDRWMREMRSAVLAVPSSIVPAEFNYLFNPQHPDFRRIKIGKPTPFSFDARLLQP